MPVTHTHGITDTAYKMFKEGESKPAGPWMCSDRCGMSYLWSAEKNKNESDDVTDFIVQRAIESAIIQCPIHEDEFFHVLLLDIPDDYEIEGDTSCENMENRADAIPERDLAKFVVGVKSYYLSKYFHPFVLAGILDNQHFSESMYSDAVIQCSRALKGAEWSYEMIQDNIKEI
jgi:hypothetical protein